MTVLLRSWRESCTCPGAEQARRRLDELGVRDLDEMWDDARGRSRARREAFQAAQQAARPRAAGKDRDEIREIYISELNARGLKIPSDTVLDLAVDNISGKPFPAIRALVTMAKEMRDLYRHRRPDS
jgi:hypothetical protein